MLRMLQLALSQHTPKRAPARRRGLCFCPKSKVALEAEPAAEPGVEVDRHRGHPAAAAVAIAVSAAGSCTYGATPAAAAVTGGNAHIAAVAPRQRAHRVAVMVLDRVMPADRVHDAMALAAVMVCHRVVQGVLDRAMRDPVHPVMGRGPMRHAAMMGNVAAAVMTGNAAAVVSGETVVRHTPDSTALG